MSENSTPGQLSPNENISRALCQNCFSLNFLFSLHHYLMQKKETLASFYNYDIFALFLIIGYFAYAKYEASRVVSCTGCQVVSFTAVALKYLIIALVLFSGSYYLVNPN